MRLKDVLDDLSHNIRKHTFGHVCPAKIQISQRIPTVRSESNLGIAIDKRGYPHNIFLISQRKHMLWVLIRSTSVRLFK